MKPTRMSVIECAVGVLIPSACRQHVLGDLRERNETTPTFVLDVLRVLPYTIWSRVRRTTSLRLFTWQAVGLGMGFLAAAFKYAPFRVVDSVGVVRIVIPISAALVALVVADAYRNDSRPLANDRVAIGSALLLGGLTQLVLVFVYPEWALPPMMAVLGGAIGWVFVCMARSGMRPSCGMQPIQATPAAPNDPDEPVSTPKGITRKSRLGLLAFLGCLVVVGVVRGEVRTGIQALPPLLMAVVALHSAWRVYRLPVFSPDKAKEPWDFQRYLLLRYGNLPILAMLLAAALEKPLADPDPFEILPKVLPFVCLSFVWSLLAWKWSARRA